ncbi:DUF2269 domain-containing protein [Amycolatopsis roodepoortensis]|uniref:DUF2269 domain-containing protein n=1 Tax=Amycolatopsis roodepoortensis TaxID=700274 RepID=UPI00214C58DF|nr:DUF2269 domain-containing protein [Amycolatopsis roodepoortensis]UUV28692.1 DUF2269 domain-containing protein [Amycolatopsis roodepoortensis]
MTLSPPARKVVLTAHVMTSVGWLGAVVAYLALDLTAVISQDIPTVRAAFLAMKVIAWSVILPLALASVLVGILNALGTSWGLFRHYWVLVKLILTVVATIVLLMELRTIDALAEIAATGADPRLLPGSLPHSLGGLVVLIAATILSVFKPRGLTRYGWRRQQDRRAAQAP